jgi:GntR family transcriptional repressor for pyruvate dehydrogenase complex
VEHEDHRPSAGTDEGAVVPATRFAVVARSNLPQEIATQLLQQIKEQELRPGDKLPPERQLAQMMDVSRPVVREALRALSLMGVVDIRQGDGTYVTSLEPRQLVAHLDFVFAKDSVALTQLLEARRVVETGNVRLAARRITEAQIGELEGIVQSLAANVDDPTRFAELDIALHSAVCAAADNFLLLQFMGIITTLSEASRERTGGIRAVRVAALQDHRRLLAALRDHDADEAEHAMQAHLDHVEERLIVTTAPDRGAPTVAQGGAR